MGRQASNTRYDSSRYCDLATIQANFPWVRFLHETARTGKRTKGNNVRGGESPSTTLFPGKARGQGRMSWIRAFIRFWRGEQFIEEEKLSKRVIEDAREAIRETRAVMDGEDSWLMRQHDQEITDKGRL